MFFVRDNNTVREQMQRRSDFARGQFMQLMSEQWRRLKAQDMKEYETKAQEDKQRHQSQVAELLENKGWWTDKDGSRQYCNPKPYRKHINN